MIKLKKESYEFKKGMVVIALLSVVVIAVQYFMQLSFPSFIYALHPFNLLMNYVPVFLVMFLIYLVSGKINIGYMVTSLISGIILAVNYFKTYFRDEPFKITDLALGKETTDMLSTYKLPFSIKILVMAIFIAVTVYLSFKYIKSEKINPLVRIFGTLITVLIMFVSYTYLFTNNNIYRKLTPLSNEFHETSVVNERGFIYSFINSGGATGYDMPDGYNKELVINELKKYEKEKTEEVIPNVIAIMSEAFFDINEGENIKYEKGRDPLYNFNKIKKEGYSGKILVPGFGGATASTEYEFLTGVNISLADRSMPTPYKDYITKNIYSLVDYFEENNFETYAIHPGYSWFYNRNNVYKYMGFDKSTFIDSLPKDVPMTNYYVNDSVTSDMIINSYKNHLETMGDKGYFNFTVTIQNHGPYMNYKTDKAHILKRPDGISDSLYYTIDNYIQGLNDADNLLKEVKDFIETVDKPTVLIFFGDHLPFFDAEQKGYETIGYSINSDDYEGAIRKYSTPYVICSNKAFKNLQREKNIKVKKGKGSLISSSFLANELYDYMGVQKPPYFAYLDEIKKDINVISPSFYIMDNECVTELSDDVEEKLNILRYMQYYNMKDCK